MMLMRSFDHYLFKRVRRFIPSSNYLSRGKCDRSLTGELVENSTSICEKLKHPAKGDNSTNDNSNSDASPSNHQKSQECRIKVEFSNHPTELASCSPCAWGRQSWWKDKGKCVIFYFK